MRSFLLTGLCLLWLTQTATSQLARYPFNADVNDELGNYNPASVFGTPDFSSGEYVALDSGEYIVLPNALQQAFDKTKSLEISVRFKVEGNHRTTPAQNGQGEEARIILSTKEDYDQRMAGFDITAREWESDLWIIATFGDGITYSDGLWSEGKLDFVTKIQPDIWYDFTIKFVFAEETPYIQYIVNGVLSTSFYDDRMDYEGFRQLIDQRQFVVGSTLDNSISFRESQHPSLDLFIDHMEFYSPAAPGNPALINSCLQALENHMKGTENYSATQLDSLQGVFVTNWDDSSYEPNETAILSYIDTYSVREGFVFTKQFNAETPEDFGPLKFIQYQLQQWMFDNLYSAARVGQMGGVVFKEHERFPGSVSAAAPRLSDASFTVDGDYQTDPGFYLNDQEYVRRPTGYYVPAGELVQVTVPDAAIGQGIELYVGATRKNLQEGWTEFRRFPRTSTTFALDTKTITIANPFGGGIYIAIPDGTQLGDLTFEVTGAVKAPFYSTKESYENSETEFLTEIGSAQVPYVDMESDNFMTTITNGMASTINDPSEVLRIWDESFDAANLALGRPQKRFRGEYIIQDRQSHAQFTAAPAAYPMSLEIYEYPYETVRNQPVAVETGKGWYNDGEPNNFHYIIFHEYGHLHNMPTLHWEQETNVHLLATAVYDQVMGESIDSAFVYAVTQRLNLEQGTFDWLFTSNFINGERIGPEPNDPGDQLLYQSRGLVKLVDIAKMFGWEAMGNIFAYFYEYQKQNPDWSPYALEDDQFIRAASEVMGFNMAPHFEFHGIIPSEALVTELSSMPTSDVIKERILHYRFELPLNNEAFLKVYNQVAPRVDPQFHLGRWDGWKAAYNEAYAQSIIDRIDFILNKYYQITEEDLNYPPVIEGVKAEIAIDRNSAYQFTLDDLLVTDQDHTYPDDHNLIINAGDNYSVTGTTVTPDQDFVGILTVPVIVNDGLKDSEPFEVPMRVSSVLSTEPSLRQVRVFPNPTKDGFIHLQGIPNGADYELRDLRGRLTQSGVVEEETIKMKAGSGVYLLEVVSLTGARFTRVIYRY